MNQEIIFKTNRRFGVEIEINSFDFLSRRITKKHLPEGSDYICNFLKSFTEDSVIMHGWRYNHNNNYWAVKPDGSCGIEICTPVLKGEEGIKIIEKFVEKMSLDKKISADKRCSFHVHVDVADLKKSEIAAIISWWIKMELFFFCCIPKNRKKNEYCRLIGLLEDFDVEKKLKDDRLIKIIGSYKYNSINCFHYVSKKRKTIEFRIMDNSCCLNSFCAKNWIIMILHFVNMALFWGNPKDYSWLDPEDAFNFIGFNKKLSNNLNQVRMWLCENLKNNVYDLENIKSNFFQKDVFYFSKKEIDGLYSKYYNK